MKALCYPLILLLASLGFQTSYAKNCVPWQEQFASKDSLRIGEIEILANDIFDLKKSKESGTIHRIANKIHIQTKPSIIKNQLLFSEGDAFTSEKLAESERALRKQRYIKSALIKPYLLCENLVSIRVETHDNWTFTPGISFSRQGGQNRSGIAIEEHNLLGLGKSLSFNYKKNATRSTKLFSYEDAQIFGTRNRLLLDFQDNTDGKGYGFSLERPFHDIDSKRSWGITASKIKEKNPIYQTATVIDKITKENEIYSIFYGWSPKKLNNTKRNHIINDENLRFKVGWSVNQTDFLQSDSNPLFQKTSLKESYPWIEANFFKEEFIKKTNFKTMGKIEDVSLGHNLTVGLGLLNKAFGSDNNQLKFSAKYSKGYSLNSNNIGFLSVQSSSYIGSGLHKGNTLSLQGELDHFNKSGNDFTLRTSLNMSNNLIVNEQIVLGGETGLHAYPTAYQTGNKSILLQAEKKMHFDWYPLHLFKFGAVFFADAGTAWGNGNNAKLLADVGVGLRLFPTRSSTGKTVHFNLSVPLTERSKVKKYQFSVGTTQAF